MSSPIQPAEKRPALRLRISSLLLRYPDVTENELNEMTAFYRTASALDTALLASNEETANKSRQFCSDQHHAIKRGLQAPLVLAIFILGTLAIAAGFALQLS